MALTGKLLEVYNSAAIKEGILCWYPFTHGTRVLDSSHGNLTNLLKSRSLEIVTSSNLNQDSNTKFDYIVLLDPDDFSLSTLTNYQKCLTPNGRLLLAYENPFALRYWAGQTAPNSGKPYDTLFGSGNNPLPSKTELESRLKKAGFKGFKWYYPLTDHWITTEVYSDSYLPNEFFNQRFEPYISDDPNLKFDERSLYKNIVEGGAFKFMCPAYLVEARVSETDSPCAVDYAAITAYREPAKRFATTLNSDGKAYKIPLSKDGLESIQNTAKNHAELNSLGVNTLDCKVQDGKLVMPRLGLPTLINYWAEQFISDTLAPDKVIKTFDRIRDDIYKAATNGKCYWELVPANCFYDQTTDELTYFDQEYVTQGWDPDIALARSVSGLRYSPVFTNNPNIECLYQELLIRYKLQDGRDMIAELQKANTYKEVFGDIHHQLKLITRENAVLIANRNEGT